MKSPGSFADSTQAPGMKAQRNGNGRPAGPQALRLRSSDSPCRPQLLPPPDVLEKHWALFPASRRSQPFLLLVTSSSGQRMLKLSQSWEATSLPLRRCSVFLQVFSNLQGVSGTFPRKNLAGSMPCWFLFYTGKPRRTDREVGQGHPRLGTGNAGP